MNNLHETSYRSRETIITLTYSACRVGRPSGPYIVVWWYCASAGDTRGCDFPITCVSATRASRTATVVVASTSATDQLVCASTAGTEVHAPPRPSAASSTLPAGRFFVFDLPSSSARCRVWTHFLPTICARENINFGTAQTLSEDFGHPTIRVLIRSNEYSIHDCPHSTIVSVQKCPKSRKIPPSPDSSPRRLLLPILPVFDTFRCLLYVTSCLMQVFFYIVYPSVFSIFLGFSCPELMLPNGFADNVELSIRFMPTGHIAVAYVSVSYVPVFPFGLCNVNPKVVVAALYWGRGVPARYWNLALVSASPVQVILCLNNAHNVNF